MSSFLNRSYSLLSSLIVLRSPILFIYYAAFVKGQSKKVDVGLLIITVILLTRFICYFNARKYILYIS